MPERKFVFEHVKTGEKVVAFNKNEAAAIFAGNGPKMTYRQKMNFISNLGSVNDINRRVFN